MKSADIKAFRNRMGWTQTDLAERLGFSLRKIQDIEKADNEIDVVIQLALETLMAEAPAEPPGRQLEMELDFHGLIAILAKNLYNRKDTFIRELIQNAHDACWRRSHLDANFDIGQAAIDILSVFSPEPGKIIFRDNGEGMTEQDLIQFLSAIGRSGTKAARDLAPETIGQFGIGFLSGFVVASRIEVRTRHFRASPEGGCLWVSDGNRDYTLAHCRVDKVGTEVTIFLRDASERGHVNDEAVRKAVQQYADMLKVPIYINDPSHSGGGANLRVMPWERGGLPESEQRLENFLYLEKRVPDNVLEVIPVNLQETQGLLYITKTRVIGTAMPRTVRVFLRRMYLCDGAVELLPPWAQFVNGIINTSSLEPNAARDNFMHDEISAALRDALGDCIIAHLERLKTSDPDRLAEILSWHEFGIKAACHYNSDFHDRFAHLLEWRINPGAAIVKRDDMGLRPHSKPWRDEAALITLPDLLNKLPVPEDGGPKRLSYFTSGHGRSQYFQMADAARSVVLDASEPFEEELLRQWAKDHPSEVSLVRCGQQDDPNLFKDIDPQQDGAVKQLAQTMSQYISPGGRGRLDVVARRIQPDALAAILKDEERSEGLNRAYTILNDANASGEVKRMAEELIKRSGDADMGMVINAANPLVRGLAELVEQVDRHGSTDPQLWDDARELMKGVYNSALLSNQRRMSAQNAQIFHEQFQRLMQRVLSSSRQVEEEKERQRQLQRELENLRPRQETAKRQRRHLRGFYVTPFDPAFDEVRREMRIFLEENFHCQLIDATDITHSPFISTNVERHLEEADFFIVDMTGLKPNIMVELGGIHYRHPEKPKLPIGQVGMSGDKFKLPADFEGLIVTPYVTQSPPTEWRQAWDRGFHADTSFMQLLSNSNIERYLTPTLVNSWSEGVIDLEMARRLAEMFPTPSAWEAAELDKIKTALGGGLKANLAANLRDAIIDNARKIGA